MNIQLKLEENNTKSFETALQQEINVAAEHFKKELAGIRSGRAHTSMIEDVRISCYGDTTQVKLREIAAISAPDVNMLIIEPWDKSIIADIERSISKSDLGLTPANDGNIIRLQLPEMSAQRREELIKILNKKLEDCRISIRNVRKDFHNIVRDNERAKKISEDFAQRLADSLQKLTDKNIETVEQLAKKKENEIKGI